MIKGSKSIEAFAKRFVDKLSDRSYSEIQKYLDMLVIKYETRGDDFAEGGKLDSAEASYRLASAIRECTLEVTKRKIEQLNAKRGMIAQQRSLTSKTIH